MVIVITGATAGFGRAMAKRFIQKGAHVIAVGRRAEKLENLRTECGPNLHPIAHDVRDRVDLETLFKDLPVKATDVDVLINNAGLALGMDGGRREQDEASSEEYRQEVRHGNGP